MAMHSALQKKGITKSNEHYQPSDNFELSHHTKQLRTAQSAGERSHADEKPDSLPNHRLEKPQNWIPLVSVALLQDGEQRLTAKICRVGARGMFVQTQECFPENTYLQALFRLPGDTEEHQLWGRVIHSAEDGLELAMDVLEPMTRDGLEALEKFAIRLDKSNA